MLSLSYIFLLWRMVVMSGLYRVDSTPLLSTLPFPSLPTWEGGNQADECYPTRRGTVQGHLGSPEGNWEDVTWWLFDLSLRKAGCLCCCWVIIFTFVLHTFLS